MKGLLIMYMYLAHIKYYCSYDEKSLDEHIAVAAESFAKALEYIEQCYGHDLEEVLNIYALSDSRLLYITENMAEELRTNGANCF